MTEEEAKTKWCPFVRFVATDEAAYNNRPAGSDETLCIGSNCMAWRWSLKRNPDWNPSAAAMSWTHPADSPPAFIRDDTQGGCGLAGSPQ